MKIGKRYFGVLATLMILALLLAACPAPAPPAAPAATSSGQAAPTQAAKPPTKLKIGLVTDVGRINDRSFNQSAWEGVRKSGRGDGADSRRRL